MESIYLPAADCGRLLLVCGLMTEKNYIELDRAGTSTVVVMMMLMMIGSDGVKAMTHEAKAKDLTCHAALKPQTV